MDSAIPAAPSGEEILKGSDISVSVSKPLNPPLWEILNNLLPQVFHVLFSHQNSQGLAFSLYCFRKIMKIGESYSKRDIKSQPTHFICL